MAQRTTLVMTLALLATLFLSIQAGGATVTYDQMQTSINEGLAWLETQQDLVDPTSENYGAWGGPKTGYCMYNHRVEKTSLAVLKMLDRASELDTSPSPEVQKGLNFIFRKVQDDGSIWDYYDTLTCGFENAPDTVTETSLAIMAIVSTGTPDAVVTEPLSDAIGMTYSDVVEDAVAHLAWTQRTREEARMSGFDDEGGWTGGKDPAGLITPYFAENPADQVHTGVASLALVHASEKFAIAPPEATLTQLQTWVKNIQDYPGSGGSYYWAPPFHGYPNIHYTGDLLIEQYLLGRTPASRDVQASIGYISDSWSARGGSYKNYFLLTRGLSLMCVEILAAGGTNMDWFDVILGEVIGGRVPDAPGTAYWLDISGDSILSTGWALLTIEGHVYPGEMTVTKAASDTDVSSGDTVTYSYTVQNTGRSAIYDLALDDDRLGIILPASGDDGDGILEPGETWTYTRDAVLSVTTRNIGKASGVDLLNRQVVAQSPPVTVYVDTVGEDNILIDIKPASCPNAFNLDETGVTSVAIVGTGTFDVTQVDPKTIYLNGVPALADRWSYEDVATPFLRDDVCACQPWEGDYILDLTLKFDHQELAASISSPYPPEKNTAVPLTLTGQLKDGTPIAGSDCILVVE